MDIATLIGLLIGLTVIVLAILEGSDLWVFLNAPGFLIVVCGTLAATMIKFPIAKVFTAFKIGVVAAFVNEKETPRILVDLALHLADEVRKGGMLALENVDIQNKFFGRGIRFCVDNYDLELIRKMLTKEMELTIVDHQEGERIFRGIGESAPAFGMIGTLVGLVQMLSNMSDPKTIGPAMAVALLTTLYGAVIANLVALPIAEKLGTKTQRERITKGLIIESVLQIHAKQSPSVLEGMLEVYLPEGQRHSTSEEPTE